MNFTFDDYSIVYTIFGCWHILQWANWYELYHNGELIYTYGVDSYELSEVIDDIPYSEYI